MCIFSLPERFVRAEKKFYSDMSILIWFRFFVIFVNETFTSPCQTMVKRKYLFLFFVLWIEMPLSGMTVKDSLRRNLPYLSGVDKLRTLEQLSGFYLNNNLDSAFYYLSLLEKTAVEQNNSHFESAAYSSLGLYYFYSGEFLKAQDFLQKAIRIQEKNQDTARLAHSYNVLAGVYGESGDYGKSIEILSKALKIYELQHNINGLEKVYNNWGYLFMKLDDYHKAMVYYKKALSLIEKYKLNNNRGVLYSDMGICYKEFGQYDSALCCYRRALNEYKLHKTYNNIPMLYQSFGNLYGFRLGKPDSALFYLSEGIKMARKYDPNSLIELYFSLGQIEQQKKRYAESLKAFDKSLQVAAKTGDLNGQQQAHYGLFRVNKKLGRFPEALFHFQQYVAFKDSVDNKETRVAIARLEEKYQNEKNQVYIQKLMEKQEADRRLKIIMLLGILTLAVMLVLVIYGIFQRRKRNKLEKELLKAEKEKVDEKLRYQNRQLASQALMMMQKNKMMQMLYHSLKNVPKETEEIRPYLNRIKHQIKRNLQSEKDWELFKLYFEQVNKTFFQKLKAINPGLTQNDLRLAALTKLGLNIKEVADVLSLSPNSIKGARHRLRVKLGLGSEEDLGRFLGGID